MAMGKRRRETQESLFIATDRLPKAAGHPFYERLNQLLAEAGFDGWIEERCRPYYAAEGSAGRPSIPPGLYFRMLLVGYFEGIDSQRGIAWRCADSLSLRDFLGLALDEASPDHSTLTNTRKRLAPEVFDEVFRFVLRIAGEKGLIAGEAVGVDSTTLEANAAMKSIVRRDTGEDWKGYVTRLMKEEGVLEPEAEPTDEEVRRYDRSRKGKKVSNREWVSSTDPASRIARMKDGRTHLAYKAEHVVDLKSDLVLAAEIYEADRGDAETMVDSVLEAVVNLGAAGIESGIDEVAADKGYHAAATLEMAEFYSLRTYIPGPKRKHDSRWTDKPADFQRCVSNNRRRVRRDKSRSLQRLRSERCERTFAHICETGGMRRSWLRGLADVTKRYRIAAAAHNLGRILWKLLGVGKPRALQGGLGRSALARFVMTLLLAILARHCALHPPRRFARAA